MHSGRTSARTVETLKITFHTVVGTRAGLKLRWYDAANKGWAERMVKVKVGEMLPGTRWAYMGYKRVGGVRHAVVQEILGGGGRPGGIDWGGRTKEIPQTR